MKTYTTARTDKLAAKNGNERAKNLLKGDRVFKIGGKTFQTYYPGEGHTTDNIVIWFLQEKILYGGCFIKSTEATGIGNVSDGNIGEWGASIHRLQRKFKSPNFIIPGHGAWQSLDALEHTLELIAQSQSKLPQS